MKLVLLFMSVSLLNSGVAVNLEAVSQAGSLSNHNRGPTIHMGEYFKVGDYLENGEFKATFTNQADLIIEPRAPSDCALFVWSLHDYWVSQWNQHQLLPSGTYPVRTDYELKI